MNKTKTTREKLRKGKEKGKGRHQKNIRERKRKSEKKGRGKVSRQQRSTLKKKTKSRKRGKNDKRKEYNGFRVRLKGCCEEPWGGGEYNIYPR